MSEPICTPTVIPTVLETTPTPTTTNVPNVEITYGQGPIIFQEPWHDNNPTIYITPTPIVTPSSTIPTVAVLTTLPRTGIYEGIVMFLWFVIFIPILSMILFRKR